MVPQLPVGCIYSFHACEQGTADLASEAVLGLPVECCRDLPVRTTWKPPAPKLRLYLVTLSEPVLNNRELAALLLLIAVLAAVSAVRPIRSSFRRVAESLFAPKLLGGLLVMLAYVGLLIWLGFRTGIWSWDLASETVTWFVGSAFVLFLNLPDASPQRGVGRRNSDSGPTSRFRSSAGWPAASKSHWCHSRLTMFTKQVSRPMDSPDPPSWPRRRNRSSELEERPGHGPNPRFLCPSPESIPCAEDGRISSQTVSEL
jgi:hypothetical protein